MDSLAIVFMLATAIKIGLDYVAGIVRRSFNKPDLNLAWFDGLALVLGMVIAWFASLNVFASVLPNPVVGTLITGFLMGGGTYLLNQVLAPVQGRDPYIYAVAPASELTERDSAEIVTPDTEVEIQTLPLRGW